MPLKEFEEHEVNRILITLANCSDIQEGETEEVLAKIFLICTKFVLADYNKIASSKIFQKKFG